MRGHIDSGRLGDKPLQKDRGLIASMCWVGDAGLFTGNLYAGLETMTCFFHKLWCGAIHVLFFFTALATHKTGVTVF